LSFQDAKNFIGRKKMVKTNIHAKEWTDTVAYFAVIIKHDSKFPEVLKVAKGHKFDKRQLAFYRNNILMKSTNSRSYQTLWAKIDSALGNISTVYFMPDGIYHKINPSTLQISDSVFLLQKKRIFLLSDATLDKKSKQTLGKKALLIGNPDFDYNIFKESSDFLKAEKSIEKDLERALNSGSGSVQKLEGTKNEITKVEKLLAAKGFETKILSEKNAQESKLKQNLKSNIIHIATHGYFDISEQDSTGLLSGSEYFTSGLLLAGSNYALNQAPIHGFPQDGVISSYEILNYDMKATDLVVLSACETGLGVDVNGNGIFGLQRALAIAGTKNIIMSLWKVSDQATSELMSHFYTYLVSSKDIKESFQKAQLKLKEKYPEPYYWGAFVLLTNN
ncbi:MAG: CHAT domain-containing protein, partial [Cytophagales bacterium]